ncbi:MAG: sigma-70 family RNA polymerase sigma factor [Chloroflexi bacterium]|nr:sigma-70 family RNA polymerase sigma factor [Chloroflexota bacterium]
MNQEDVHIIQRCLAGDEKAWHTFVERYARLVYSIPIRSGLSTDDADDVFQNVFSIAFRHLAQLRQPGTVAAWLITITHRETLRALKQYHRQDTLDDDIEDSAAPPPDQLELWERQHIVREALRKTGSPCRELLTALFLESPKPSYDKLAIRLKMPIGSLGPTRARCFKKFEALVIAMGFDYIAR